MKAVRNALRAFSSTWPLWAALLVGVITTAAIATVRHKVGGGETVEALAQQYYGDARRAPVIRAANRMSDDAQPSAGETLKVPGPTIHTVQAGETLQKIADRFLSGEGGDALLAEVNGLAAGARLKPGQVITVFGEVEVRTNGRSAEDLATVYLGDPNLGARVRRYNGAGDGGKLPGKVYLPLVGFEPRSGTSPGAGGAVAAAPVAPVVAQADPVPPAADPTAPVAPVAPVPPPPVAPVAPVAPPPVAPAPPVAPVAPPPAVVAAPAPLPTALPGPDLDLSIPVTGKKASLVGFSHAMHTPMTIGGNTIGCIVCHERTTAGAVTHKAPSQGNCMICHKQSEALPEQLRKGNPKRLPLPMNHKLHVGDNGLDCTICHKNEVERPLGIITNGHEACVVCHREGAVSPWIAASGVAADNQCVACHGTVEEFDEGSERTRYLRTHMMRPFGRTGDVFFTHMTHATFSSGGAPGNGPAIDCKACHADAYTAETKEQISRVGMQGCVECHRQANAVGLQPPESCQGCHLHHRQGHMPTNELILSKPLDHTSMFRRHHAEQARTNAPMCASCHAGVDPKDGNRCDTCHATMKPRDHTAGFRDRVHGRQAQIDPARCTTCHRAERCESCHREIPKSHFPQNVWVEKGVHGSRARLELGACLTCHRFETTCARCHTNVAN